MPNGDGTSSARILDNGEVASNALRAFDHPAGEDPARCLAEHVLGMDFVTDRGLRARELARNVLAASGGEAPAEDALQGAANWLVEAVSDCEPGDIQHRLFIGFNRAKRLYDAALAAKSQKGGAAC